MSGKTSHCLANAFSWSLLIISTIGISLFHPDETNAFSVSFSNGYRRRIPGGNPLEAHFDGSRFAVHLPSPQSSSTALRAGPNPFVNNDAFDGLPPINPNEGGGTSSPFGIPPINSNKSDDGNMQGSMSKESGDIVTFPNPFLQPNPAAAFGNNPFGGGPAAGSEYAGSGGGQPSAAVTTNTHDFASNVEDGGRGGDSTISPNPFQQTQPQTPPANPFHGGGPAQIPSAVAGSENGFGPPLTNPSFPVGSKENVGANTGASLFQQQTPQSSFGQNGEAGGEQMKSSPFGAGPSSPPPPSLQQNGSMGGSTLSLQPAVAVPGSSPAPPNAPPMPAAADTWIEFSIHPGHAPDPAFMTTTSTDYSNAIPRGLVLRTVKPGTRFGHTMTQKAEVSVSLGEEPMGQGVDDTEEPEKVWDLGPGEYVVNRGTRLDKTRMYVMDFEPSTTREGGVVLRTVNPGIVDEWGNNVRLAEVCVSGGPDGKWREPKPQMEGMAGIVGGGMMDGGGGAMGGVDGGSDRVSRGFVTFSSGSLGPARRGSGNQEGGEGYTYGPAPQTGGDPYSLW